MIEFFINLYYNKPDNELAPSLIKIYGETLVHEWISLYKNEIFGDIYIFLSLDAIKYNKSIIHHIPSIFEQRLKRKISYFHFENFERSLRVELLEFNELYNRLEFQELQNIKLELINNYFNYLFLLF